MLFPYWICTVAQASEDKFEKLDWHIGQHWGKQTYFYRSSPTRNLVITHPIRRVLNFEITRNNPWCRNSNKKTTRYPLSSLSAYYASLLGVTSSNTPPQHTPGLRVFSRIVVRPVSFPSTSTLQKGSENPFLIVWARVWWHRVCARMGRVCVQNWIELDWSTSNMTHLCIMLHQALAVNPTSLHTKLNVYYLGFAIESFQVNWRENKMRLWERWAERGGNKAAYQSAAVRFLALWIRTNTLQRFSNMA
jgi:hypothetical protein